jgi:hypothetical protein
MEHYCSLQVSQLLVKLGFKQKTNAVYAQFNVWKHGEVCKIWSRCSCGIPIHAKKGDFPCPTHAEAIEWLRKYKKVLIGVQACVVSQIPYTYEAIAEWINTDDYQCITIAGKDHFGYKTPFKATEAALKFVIRNLLKN